MPSKQQAQNDFYTNYNSNIDFVSKSEVGHNVPSIFRTNEGQMAYDLAGDLFDHLLKNLEENSVTAVNAATTSWETVGSFRRFNQQEFVDDGLFGYAGLGEWGYLYYPDSCKSKSCKVHMHLHGCTIINQGFTTGLF